MKKLFKFIPDTIPENLHHSIKSIPEEYANMISHGAGLMLFIVGLPFLLYKSIASGVGGYTTGNLVFGISLLMVYSASTLYHSVFRLRLRSRLRTFDHISIYFLIAGSFTPFLLVYLRSERGTLVLITLWLMVLIGSVFKFFFTDRVKLVSTMAYVGMAGMALFVIEPLSLVLPEISYSLLKLGMISYLIGVPFYLWQRLYFNHLIWHLFVLGGSVSHFLAIWYLID